MNDNETSRYRRAPEGLAAVRNELLDKDCEIERLTALVGEQESKLHSLAMWFDAKLAKDWRRRDYIARGTEFEKAMEFTDASIRELAATLALKNEEIKELRERLDVSPLTTNHTEVQHMIHDLGLLKVWLHSHAPELATDRPVLPIIELLEFYLYGPDNID